MKFTLLAAAAFIATPIIAQSTPAANMPSTQTTPSTTDSTAPADGTMQNAPQTTPAPMDPSMQSAPAAPANQSMQSGAMTTGSGAMASGDSSMSDPAGGYQPSRPAISGTAQPGQPVQFQAAQSPDQAYPAPAPMASYPVCKKGQYDNCREGGSGTSGRKMMRHRRK